MPYQNILDEIVHKSKLIFKEELTGIYLHGSLAMGCFNPNKSDIDLIIVISNGITDIQKLQFMNHIAELNKMAPGKGIELSIVKKEYCKNFLYPTPFELHFSNAHLQWFIGDPIDYIHKMNGTDKDLAAHFKIIKKYGIVLQGEAINNVFADVPGKDYIDSIWLDVKGAKEDISNAPVYVILNLCRVAAFLKNDLILSKKQGGEWALQNLSAQYHTLISNAVQSYTLVNEMDLDNTESQKFADYMLQMIKGLLIPSAGPND
jgi:Nucleotidyltransferase domain.